MEMRSCWADERTIAPPIPMEIEYIENSLFFPIKEQHIEEDLNLPDAREENENQIFVYQRPMEIEYPLQNPTS